mgnify:CR=1 FL=1
MSELARRSGVPAATIKHYVLEGLLPQPKRTSRNMAYYDAALVPRIRAIKELQRTRFLPLKIIKDVLERAERFNIEIADAVQGVLAHQRDDSFRTRDDLLAAGVPEVQLKFFETMGLVTPETVDGAVGFRGDDLALLRLLGSARKAGLDAEMLPYTILEPYMEAVRNLARVELELFEQGIAARAEPADVERLVTVATDLGEQLTLLLRRKMLRALTKRA